MRSTEATAKTRQEAIQKALDKLGVELHEVEIEILDEGSKGFMGIGARDVQVLIKAPHLPDDKSSRDRPRDNFGNKEAPPAPTSRDSDRGGRGGQRRNLKPRGERQQGGQREARPPREGRPKREGRPQREGRPPREGRPQTDSRPPRRERNDRASQRKSTPRPPRPAPKKRTEPVDREAAESLGNSAAALLNEIIQKMGIEATVESSLNNDDDILLSVSSEDSAILIGRKGRNLSSMQFVINRIMLTEDDADTVDRIIVDVEGYLDRRRESLEDMARSMAKKAKATGRTIRVKPLTPQERRVIHLTLEDDEDVRTYSTGDSMHRRVVIVPNEKGTGEDYEEPDTGSDDDEDESAEHESATSGSETSGSDTT